MRYSVSFPMNFHGTRIHLYLHVFFFFFSYHKQKKINTKYLEDLKICSTYTSTCLYFPKILFRILSLFRKQV